MTMTNYTQQRCDIFEAPAIGDAPKQEKPVERNTPVERAFLELLVDELMSGNTVNRFPAKEASVSA